MKALIMMISLFSLDLMANDICEFKILKFESLQVQTGKLGVDNCFIKVSGHEENGAMRSHLFTQKGLYQIFNSFHLYYDGVKEFWFDGFEKLKFYKIGSQKLNVQLKPGLSFVFDSSTALIHESNGLNLKEDIFIHPHNDGGVNIMNSDFDYIEFKFSENRSPRSLKDGEFVFNKRVKSCHFSNKTYINYKDSNLSWKYSINNLFGVLRNQCL